MVLEINKQLSQYKYQNIDNQFNVIRIWNIFFQIHFIL